jgi:hypothetical protein
MERLLQQVVSRGGAEMNLAIVTAHAGAESLNEAIVSWGFDPHVHFCVIPDDALGTSKNGIDLFIVNGKEGMIPAYQHGSQFSHTDNMAFLHDDTIIMDRDWSTKVMREFEDPYVGLVGFGGSRTHGHPDLYKIPYEISQLSRGEYLSNALDAETHGTRYEGPPIDAAVLDGFALIFRREVLEKAGGWPVKDLVFHGYDFWACCMTHRLGYRIRLVPIKCHHLGGRTSVAQNMDDGQNHAKGHRWIYDNFKDCIPWRCA